MARRANRLDEVQRADDIHPRVERRVGDALSHIDLCPEVRDHIEPTLAYRARRFGAREINLDEVRAFRDVFPPAGGEVVEHRHVVAVLEIEVSDVRTDEPGAAGHESAWHVSAPRRLVRKTSSRLKSQLVARSSARRPRAP